MGTQTHFNPTRPWAGNLSPYTVVLSRRKNLHNGARHCSHQSSTNLGNCNDSVRQPAHIFPHCLFHGGFDFSPVEPLQDCLRPLDQSFLAKRDVFGRYARGFESIIEFFSESLRDSK